jgi:Tfp pilus assembly protein PilF
MAYVKNGDDALAKEAFSKALKLDQNFREAKQTKAALDEIQTKRS